MEDMQHQAMGYDRAAQTFSPEGRILQVEYADKTVRLGSASIGMVCKDGVILVSDKRQKDKLVVESSTNKIAEIDEHIMTVAAGIVSDARVLIDKARVIAQQHRVTYDSEITVESTTKEVADIKQQFTQYGGARPYGVSLMIAGFDSSPRLFTTDVFGSYWEYKANAIGENDEKMKDRLRQEYKSDMTCEDGIKLALKIFKEVEAENFEKSRLDIGIMKSDKKLVRKKGSDY
ncbi:Proteasome subunit alpha [uncultured archaeon]|nr:Proteasome subunit alpha [uncultured archaeon]